MASRNKDERAHVNALIKAIQKNSPDCYVYIDRDAGNARHTSSGWDFQLSLFKKIVYCEAKEENGKLSDWQEFTRALIHAAGTPYKVIRFWNDGVNFSVDDDGFLHETADAEVALFLSLR